jgi:hypothetical protein
MARRENETKKKKIKTLKITLLGIDESKEL